MLGFHERLWACDGLGNSPAGVKLHKTLRSLVGVGVAHGEDKGSGYKVLRGLKEYRPYIDAARNELDRWRREG